MNLSSIDVSNLPEAKFFSAGPFAATADEATYPQWRGAHSSWAPALSKYGADRGNGNGNGNDRRHWGWDFFAPAKSRLVAQVWPSQMTIPPHSDSFRNSLVFSFVCQGKVYHIAYSHPHEVIGVERYIRARN